VLAHPRDAFPAGGAVALGAARGVAVVCVCGAAEPPAVRAPARPAALRLHAKLAARGCSAWATGRLVVVVVDAVADVPRVLAAAGPVATVTVLAGPRDPAGDALLRQHDALVVATGADADDPLTALAVLELAPLGLPVRTVRVPTGARRLLAAVGLTGGSVAA